jgi:cytochrome P450
MNKPERRCPFSPNLYLATNEEKQAQAGSIWNSMRLIGNFMRKLFYTAGYYCISSNPLLWLNRITLYRQSKGFFRYPTFFRTLVVTGDPEVMKTIYAEHRNGEFFEGSRGFKHILNTIRSIYPKDVFNAEDCILTCGPEQTQIYRELLREQLILRIAQLKPEIQKAAETAIEGWVQRSLKQGKINLTTETSEFASWIIAHVVLGFDRQKTLFKSVNLITKFLIKSISHPLTAFEQNCLKDCYGEFREAVDSVLLSERPMVQSMRMKNFSQSQMKAMIFTLFLVGQETTASLLNEMIWMLAKSQQRQKDVREDRKAIDRYFDEVMRNFPPAWILYRTVRENLFIHGTYIKKGEVICPLTIAAAQNRNAKEFLPFGDGVHKCPGLVLAKTEIKTFVQLLIQDYEVATEQHDEIEQIGGFTLQRAEDIFITLVRR